MPRKIGIYGKKFDDAYIPGVQNLFDEMGKQPLELHIYEPFLDYLHPRVHIRNSFQVYTNFDDAPEKLDFLVSVGGDGTFLDAASYVRDSGTPIIGINTGRLGFLAGISLDEVSAGMQDILNSNYDLDSRTALKLKTESNLFGNMNFALNELTIHKKDSSSMITIHAYLNGEYLNSYWADGLIVSTPTGSTAYSMSCGGPIVMPGSNNFIITPVAPHNLNVRPIVIPDNMELTLKVEGRSNVFLVSLDSRSESIESGNELTITRSEFSINILKLKHHHYLSTIRNKLNWGFDKRN